MSVNPILEELKKRGYQVDQNSAYRIGNASGYRSAAVPYVKSYSDLLNERLQLGLQYAQQGPEHKKDLADSISPGGAMTEYKKGDWLNFDFDARQAAEIDSAKAVDYYSSLGLFDSKDFAYDKRYLHLPQTSYLSGLLPALDEEIAKSQKADVDAYNIRQQSAETSDRWLGLRNAPNETDMDRWYNMLMADYLLGDRSELFDFEAIDNRYGEMSDEEYEREYQRLADQWNNLDWETLTGSKANNYQSKTPELQGYKQSISKELERRNALEALQASIRSDANYSALSAYTDTYTEPDSSNWFLDTLAGNTAKYTVKGYDDLSRFLNADATFADKYIAGKDSHAVQYYLDNGYDYIAPDELADYNALINAGRTEEAKRYLELLRPELLMRRANVLQSYQTVKAQNPYLAVPTFIDAGILNLENVLHLPQQIYEAAKGIDSPYSAAFDALNKNQWTTSAQLDTIAESNMPDWLKTVSTYAYQGVTSIRDNAMRILAGGGSPTVSLIIAGLQSGSGSLHESSERDDMSGAAKIIKAIGTAAVEVGTEKIGLDALFSKGKNGALAYIKNVILSEVGEEVLNAASEPVLEAVVAFLFDHEADIMSGPEFWKNLTDTAITTAISSVFMGAGGAVSQDMNTRAAGKDLKKNGDLEGVLKIAEAYGDNEAVSVAAKDIRDKQAAGKEASVRDIGKLVNSLGQAIGEKNAKVINGVLNDSIKERLIVLGEEEANAAKLADAIRTIYQGGNVSPAVRAGIKWSKAASQVTKELASTVKVSDFVVPGSLEGLKKQTEDGTWVAGDALAAESQRTGKAWVTEAEAKVQAEDAKAAEEYVKFSEAMNAKRPKRPLPSASKNYTVGNSKKKAADIMAGKEKLDRNQLSAVSDDYGVGKIKGKFKRFEKADDGFKVVLESDTKSENGKPVEVKAAVSDIDNAGDAGLLTIAKYAEDDAKHQMTAEEVNIMANAYMAEVDSNPDADVGTFIEKFEDSYTAGYIGAETVTDGISETAAKIAYEQGRMEAETDEANRVKRAGKVRAESNGEVSFIGKVKDSSEVKGKGDPDTLTADMKNMTSSQRTAVQIVQAFAKKFKTNVVLFESDADSISNIENGSYDLNTNTIYIDINSGAYSAEGIESGKKHNTLGFAMVRTLGHELTHHLESTSAEGYAAYKTAVKKMLKERGEDWAMLVRGKMDSARTAGYKLTYAGAEAEVVADASEYILQNSKFAKEIDAETHSKIKRFIKGFMRKLGEVFQQLTGSHRESAALRQEINGVMQYLGDIQNLWDAAMEESIGREVSAEAVGEQEALPVQYMARNNPFDRAVEVHNVDYHLENALTREERLQLDDRLHYRILFPEKRKGIKIGSDFTETITVHGDHTKLVVMRRGTELGVSILDVYNVNTTGYNGRIAELTKSVEEAIKKHGAKWFERCYRFTSWDDSEKLFSRWDRGNLLFPAFEENEQGTIRDETQGVTYSPGIGSNRTGDAGSGEVRQNSLREDTSEAIGIDEDTESAAPLQYSIRTWADSDYVTRRDEAAKRLADSIGVSVRKAKKWIDDVNSVSAYILGNKARLDYIPTAVKGMSAFKSNPEYGGSIDMSTICAKRRLATGTLDAIQRVLGDAVLTKDDFLHIREMMKERGHEVACGLCFVESSRKNLSKYNKQFLDQYKTEHPDSELGMVDLNTVEGLERIRSNPETADVYAAYEKFMNKLAQRKPKLFEKRTEYNHEILKKFKSDTTVGVKNRNGGLRLQSFSDFEIVHLIDMMQVITDMASVGLAGQAYTKVPDFAWALGDTGLKINLSLIAKDVDEDGNLVFDDVEGMNHLEAEKLRNAYSKNVGTIVVTFTDEQTIAAMKSDFIDYIIPFHRSQWQKGDYKKLGLPEGTKDYTIHQNEKEGRKRVKENFLPNAYWQDDLSGTENAKYYLDMCAKAGRTPKFAKFLVNNGDGSYSLQPDGSTDGYWKLLIDFKMYDNDGNRSKQLPVQPNFNMEQAMRMLEEYKGEHDSFPVAQDVVDAFVKEYRGDVGGVKNTDGRYTVSPVQKSIRDLPEDTVTYRDYLTEADSSIAATIEERNALSIYQKLLKNHAEASEKVIEAEAALAAADEAHKPEARKALAAARVKQKDLYNRLLNVERTAHVQTLVKRSNQIIGDLYGKDRADLDKMLSDKQRQIESLKADITGLKGAARTQREADIREREREVAALKSKATQALLANSERYQQQIADIRLRRDLNVEIGKRTRHIKRIVKRLNDRIIHEEDYKNVKEPLKPAVHKLVQTFIDGFGNMVFDENTAGKLKSVYDMLKQEDETAEYFDEEVSDWLTTLAELARQDEARRASGSTLENLNDKLYIYTTLSDIVDHVAHMVTAADTMFIEGKKAEASAVTEEVGNTLAAKKDRRELAGWAGELARFADNLIVKGNMIPQFFFEGLNNKGMMRLYDDLQNGVRKYSERMLVGDEFLSDVMRRHGYHAWGGMKKPVSFKTKQGHTIYLTRENMMWIYATAKREASNPMMDTHHLDEGGITYEEIPTEKGRQIEGKGVHHLIVAEDVAEITKMLTAEQIAYVDECVEFLSTECAEWGNEASLKLFGIKKYKEGYYFPFKVDSDQLHKNSAAGATSTVSDARVKHISFSHSIKKGANTPLVMGNFTSVITDHINQMATYSGMVVPIENMSRVLNRKVDDGHENVNIRSLIARKYGDNTARYIDDLLKDLNGGPQTDNRGSLDAGLRLFKRNAVVGKLSVALQQPTAVTRAFAYISPRWFANLHLERPKHTWERMMKYSSTTFLKDMGGFNVGMGKGASNWLERGDLGDYRVYKRAKFLLDQKSLKDAVGEWNDFLTGLPGFMDKITWCAIWNATENEQAHQHPNMDRNSEEFLELVGHRFDDIVNHTQVYDSILSKSQNMRSKNVIAKMATSFMAESTLNMNLAYRAIASKDGKQIAKVTSSLILNAVLGAAAYALIGAFNKDDDDRTWEEKYATAFAGRLADNLNPLASIPYLSDLWNKLQGYDVERTDIAFLLDLIEGGGKFWNKMTNPDEKLSYRDYENFVGGLISTVTGIPAKNWMGDARRIWNMTHTSTEDAPLSSVWYGVLDEVVPGRESTSTAYYERFLAALKDGDKQEQYDLKEFLTKTKGVKEDTIRNGVVNAYKKEYLRGGIAKNEAIDFLVKNDLVKGETADKKKQAAFKKVDEWGEGSEDYSVYNTIFDAVKKGNTSEITKGIKEMTANGYVESDVVSGVRSLIRESYMEGNMTQSQVKAVYKSHFAPKNFDVNDQNEWYWLFRELDWGKKNHNSTDGYSNYIFLKDNFSKYNESAIRTAWNELTAHGYEDKDVKTYVRTYILKPMVQEGKISTARATELLKRWAPYNKDSDNLNKPKEWAE